MDIVSGRRLKEFYDNLVKYFPKKTDLDKKADRQTSGGGFQAGRNANAGDDPNIAIGKEASASSTKSIAIGDSASTSGGANGIAIGAQAHSIEDSIAIGTNALADNTSIALGQFVDAQGLNNVVIGNGTQDEQASNAVIIGNGAHSGGMGAQYSKIIVIGNNAQVEGDYGIAIGSSAYASTNDIIIGGNFNEEEVQVDGNIAIGNNVIYDAADNGIVIGSNAEAYEPKNIVLGANSNAKGTGDIVIGTGSDSNPNSEDGVSTETNAIIIGNNSKGYSHDDNIIIGSNASAEINSVIIGNTASGTANASIGIGNSVSAGEQSVVIGAEASGKDSGSIAIGYQSSAGGSKTNNSIAIGTKAKSGTIDPVDKGGGIAIGAEAHASNETAVVIGNNAISANGIAIGSNAYSNSPGVAIGNKAEIMDDYQGNGIQLGAGTLADTNTILQVANYPMLTGDGKIPEERLPQTKASIPFGEGTLASISDLEIKVTIDGVTELNDGDLFLIQFPGSMQGGMHYELNINGLGAKIITFNGIDDIGNLDVGIGDSIVLLRYNLEQGQFAFCNSSTVSNANVAECLNVSNIGSTNQPVYFQSGRPKACTGTLFTLSDNLTYEAVS